MLIYNESKKTICRQAKGIKSAEKYAWTKLRKLDFSLVKRKLFDEIFTHHNNIKTIW